MAVEKNKILIRADAGVAIGGGHLFRMLALANGCRKLGFQVTFLVGEIPGSMQRKLDHAGCDVVTIASPRGSQQDATQTREVSERLNVDWVVLDGYCFGDQYQHAVKSDEALLMVVDDFGHGDHVHADLVLNQNAQPDASRYQKLRHTKVLCGTRYTMLKPEFGSASDNNKPAPTVRSVAKRILVTMGSTDSANYTLPVLQALAQIDGCRAANIVVDCVIGPNFAHEVQLREFERSSNFSFRIHRNVDRIDVLMGAVDLAITAGGGRCYELAKLGVPGIAIPTSKHQIPVVKDLSKRNTLCRFRASQIQRDAVPNTQTVLSKFIKTLIDDPIQRQSMSDAGRKLIDGMGANRVSRALYSELLVFRNVRAQDADVLLGWRNDPEVRSVCFDGAPIDSAEHEQRLIKSLETPERILLMAEDRSGNAIGKIQIDFTHDHMNTVKIGIVVGAEHRSRGVGTTLIEKATSAIFSAEKKVQQIVAQVKPGNMASERAFRNAGFISTSPTMVDEQVAYQFILHRFYHALEDFNTAQPSNLNIARAA